MMIRLSFIVMLAALWGVAPLPAEKVVHYRDFGAKGDGKTDDFAALIKAHEHANQKGLPVRAEDGATYYIGGAAQTIRVETSTDFGKAKFIIDDTKLESRTKDVFEIKSAHAPIKLKDQKPVKQSQAQIDVDLPGPSVIRLTNKNVKRFIRRGGNENSGSVQTDIILVDKNGNVDPATPIIWDFDQVTEMMILPVDEEVLTIKGGHFTTIANQAESKYNYHARGIAVRRSNVVIEGLEHHVTGEGKTGAPYGGFIDVANCANVLVKDTILTGRKTYKTTGRAGMTVSMGSYDISLNRAMNVTLKNVTQTNDIMDRTYWGIIGTNFCKNLTYDGCKLSRFDAHQGVTNATIKNSVLGHSSVRLTGFGTFTMENSTVHGMPFISLRQDYGSTWTGDIHIKNCTYIPRRGSRAYILGGSNDGKHDFGYRCQMPARLVIDGLMIQDGNMSPGYKGPAIFADFIKTWAKAGPKPKHPYGITREVIHRGIVSESRKPLRLSDNPSMFREVKVTEKK